MAWMKSQERYDGAKKVLDVFRLSFISASDIRLFAASVVVGGTFGLKFDTNPLNRGQRGPHAFRKHSPPLLFLYSPMLAGSLHSASQSSVTRWKQNPILPNS